MTAARNRLYLVILSGPAASGKSTIAFELWKLLPHEPAHIDLDALKHAVFVSEYNDRHLDLARRNGIALLGNYLKAGHGVIVSKAFCKYRYVQPFIAAARKRRVPFFYFKLTASLEELLRRNKTRQHYIPEWKVEAIFREAEAFRHRQGVEIDTEKLSVAEIVEYIRSVIANHYK